MKNVNRFSILTSLVAAVFILSLLSGTAWAQNPAGLSGDPHQLKFENTGKLFEDAKKHWENAQKQLGHNKDEKSNQELIEKNRDYLEKAIDHIISSLDVMKSRAENSENKGIFPFDVSSNIDTHIAELENLRKKVQQDNTKSELRADNQELKDIYARIRLETRYDYQILLNSNIGKFIGKADNVTARMDAAIQNLRSKGKDTLGLEKAEADFKNLMQEAADDQQKTDVLLTAHNGFGADGTVTDVKQAEVFLKQVDNSQRETIKKLKDASRQLMGFARDFRKLSGGKAVPEGGGRAVVTGNGILVANGSGRALIEGNVNVTLSGINGTLIVSNNTAVTTDGTNQTLGNDRVQYRGFTFAIITPLMANENMNIRVAISGNNINLTATCDPAATTCNTVLNGNIKYSISGVGGNWSVSVSERKEDAEV